MYDIFNDGQLDLFVNVVDVITAPRIRTYFYRPNTISGISPTGQPIDNIKLHQNYPNPFNGTTRIRFQLPAQGIVTLTIYDILGKEVARLIDQKLYAPDNYETVWNGANQNGKEVSSGIYFYEVNIVSPMEQREVFRQINKMLLIR
ncbi:MAG: T9SS type A sorting domain-containing protein [Calditrichae bacterium]|nr:T9SS type A sorting domain-containing protein [Calditrichia bacterium]